MSTIKQSRVMRIGVWIGMCFGALIGCDGFGPGGFTALPGDDAIDLAAVQPAQPVDHWEFRIGSPLGVFAVLGGAGTRSRVELDPVLRETFDAVTPTSGSYTRCLPASCYYYLAVLNGDSIWTVSTPEQLLAFLGALESVEEAALLAGFRGFDLGGTIEESAYRPVPDGWELRLVQLVESCDPVQLDRVLLRIAYSGEVTEVRREVWRREFGVCI
jgi:hypothetical protein